MDNKKRYLLGVAVTLIGLVLFSIFGRSEQPDEHGSSYENTYENNNETPSLEADTQEKNPMDTSLEDTEAQVVGVEYRFRNQTRLQEHFEKHGKEMGFSKAEDYEAAASAVVTNPAALHKTEAEDGDDVYYVEETNEFVIVSTDGYLRTYFLPSGGIDYYNRQ